MAVRKAAGTDRSQAAKAETEGVEQKVVALAEQLGGLLGTVRAKVDGWLDRETLLNEVGRIRDGAADLLELMNRVHPLARTPAKSAVAVAPRPSRGAVDAPGKRHRKPTPHERLDKRMGEPVGKKMGQKSAKGRIRAARG